MFKRNDLVEIYRRGGDQYRYSTATYIGRVTSTSLCGVRKRCKWATHQAILDSFCLACSGNYVRVQILYRKIDGRHWEVYPWGVYRRRGLKFANVNIKRITKEELALLKLEVGK